MPKKKVEPVKEVTPQVEKKYHGFSREQDMLTFCFLWTSRKDLQLRCKEAIRKNSKTKDLLELIKQIAIDGTSPRASIYAEILDDFNNKTNWEEIANKMKEQMAFGE